MLKDETGQAAVTARSPHKNRLLAVMRRVVKFFEEEHAEVFDLAVPTPTTRRSATTNLVFQFKITLLGAKPPIWRRILVQDCTLDKLHEHIQTAMGWTYSHLHQFEIKGQVYGEPELLHGGFEDSVCKDSTRTMLSDILPTTSKRFAFKYEYDFGDSWRHEVLLEGHPPTDPKATYPLCINGKRACPPEDCGGVWGYVDFLEAICIPKDEDMLEWIGG